VILKNDCGGFGKRVQWFWETTAVAWALTERNACAMSGMSTNAGAKKTKQAPDRCGVRRLLL